MDTEQIKIEPPIMVKEEQEFDSNENIEIKLEIEEKPQLFEEFTSEKKKQSISGFDKKNVYVCCHCGVKKESEEMAQMPNTLKEFEKWSRILGQKYHGATLMVCRNHFDDEFGDSKLIDVIHRNDVVETIIGDRWKCCYCGNKRQSRTMTRVPRDEHYFGIWVDILGEEFEKHFERKNSGYICRDHFDVEWLEKRPKGVFPVVAGNAITRPNTYITANMLPQYKNDCGYCGESKYYRDLTMVPQSLNTLRTWGQILGSAFYEKALGNRRTFICRTHFDVKWNLKRPCHLLPCVETVEMGKSNEVKEETVQYLPDANIGSIDLMPVANSIHIPTGYEKESTLIRNPNIGKKITCGFCGKLNFRCDSTQIPENLISLKKWGDILGEEFYLRALGKKSTYICRGHFEVKWEVRRPRGVLPFVMPFELFANEVNEEVEEEYITAGNSSPASMRNASSSSELIKLEEHDNSKNIDNRLTWNNTTDIEQDHFTFQDGPSEMKRIKLEVKKEEE